MFWDGRFVFRSSGVRGWCSFASNWSWFTRFWLRIGSRMGRRRWNWRNRHVQEFWICVHECECLRCSQWPGLWDARGTSIVGSAMIVTIEVWKLRVVRNQYQCWLAQARSLHNLGKHLPSLTAFFLFLLRLWNNCNNLQRGLTQRTNGFCCCNNSYMGTRVMSMDKFRP